MSVMAAVLRDTPTHDGAGSVRRQCWNGSWGGGLERTRRRWQGARGLGVRRELTMNLAAVEDGSHARGLCTAFSPWWLRHWASPIGGKPRRCVDYRQPSLCPESTSNSGLTAAGPDLPDAAHWLSLQLPGCVLNAGSAPKIPGTQDVIPLLVVGRESSLLRTRRLTCRSGDGTTQDMASVGFLGRGYMECDGVILLSKFPTRTYASSSRWPPVAVTSWTRPQGKRALRPSFPDGDRYLAAFAAEHGEYRDLCRLPEAQLKPRK